MTEQKTVCFVELNICRSSKEQWRAKGKLEMEREMDMDGNPKRLARYFKGVLSIAGKQCVVEMLITPTMQTEMFGQNVDF